MRGSVALTLLMAAMAIAAAVYAAALAIDAPGLAASPGGPYRIDTTVLLAVDVAVMLAGASLAAITSVRGARALRSLID